MVMQEDLSAGLAAIKTGDLARARELFARAVKANPQSEEAWLQLGLVLEEPGRREYCFQRVLKLNPQNEKAKQQLTKSTTKAPAWATESTENQSAPDTLAPTPLPASSLTSPSATLSPPTEPPTRIEPPTPAPLIASKCALESAPGGIERMLVALLGVVFGLLLCGGPILYVVQTGRVDPLLPVALVPPFVPTFTPTLPTATPTRTSTPLPPTPVPSSTPTLTKQEKPDYAAADTERAEALMSQRSYAEAIPVWDRVIAAGPENGRPYIRRAVAYLHLLSNQRNMSEYVDYINKALADTDKAIAIGPATGDYYLERFRAYYNLAGTKYFRVDRDRLYELARENLKMSIVLGNTQGASDLDIASTDISLGRCDQAIDTINRVLAAARRTNSPDAYSNTLLSQGYLCKGKFDEALRYIDSATKQEEDCCRSWTRAIILTNMGRLDDALAQLTEMIDAKPYYSGSRYYLRALIYYDLKKPDLAKKDLMEGSGNTWSRYDLMSYVLGRMALDDGDRTTAVEQLRLAEATFSRDYGPLIDRVRRDLRQLNAQPLVPTLSVSTKATPMAIPKVTATPLGKNIVPTPMPTPKGATPISLEAGTGSLILQANDYPLYRFRPSSPIKFKTVQSLSFKISTADPEAALPLQLYLWNAGLGGWGFVQLKWGDNTIPFGERYVGSQGEITAALRNANNQTFHIDNAGFTLVVQQADGKTAVYGLK